MDNRKVILSTYLTAAMLTWFLLRTFIQWLHTTFYQIRKLPGVAFGREALPVVLAIVVFAVLFNHKKVNEVMDEVVAELKKVTWPSREDVVKSTWVVMICIAFASLVLVGFDLLWGKMISFLLKG